MNHTFTDLLKFYTSSEHKSINFNVTQSWVKSRITVLDTGQSKATAIKLTNIAGTCQYLHVFHITPAGRTLTLPNSKSYVVHHSAHSAMKPNNSLFSTIPCLSVVKFLAMCSRVTSIEIQKRPLHHAKGSVGFKYVTRQSTQFCDRRSTAKVITPLTNPSVTVSLTHTHAHTELGISRKPPQQYMYATPDEQSGWMQNTCN